MAADWIGIDSSYLLAGGAGIGFCGEGAGNTIQDALDGIDYWSHSVNETHWFIIDLGNTISITKVRGRSNTDIDPTSINIYISDDTGSWGVAVASGITTWQDRNDWDGNAVINVTPKSGRYVKIEIISSEFADFISFGKVITPFIIFDVYGEGVPVLIEPSVLTLVLTQQSPNIVINITIIPSALTLALVVLAPTIIIDNTVTPSVLVLELDLLTPTILIDNIIVEPSVLSLEMTLHAPNTITSYTTIPPFMQKDLIDPYSSGAWLWLVEIAVSGYDTQRIARNTEDVKYRGEDYDEFNLQIGEQIFSGDGSIPRITLRILQDRNRRIEDIINETEGALGAEVKLIRVNENFLDSPVSALEADYDLLASESDSEWVTFTLGIPNPLTQRFPLEDYSSSVCPWTPPGLFKGPKCQYIGIETSCTGTYDDCRTNKNNAIHFGAELGLSPSVAKE